MKLPAAERFQPGLGATLAIGTLLLIAVAYGDYWTGIEIGFSLFYLFPVCFVAWYAGLPWGLAFAALGTVLWFANETWLGQRAYSHTAIPVWNAVMRGSYFAIATLALSLLQADVRRKLSIAKLKGEMLSIVSHEFGNHITVLTMSLTLLREYCSGRSRENQLLDAMDRTVAVIKRSVGNFLNAARMESGKFALNTRATELRRLVDETLLSMEPLIKQKGIVVEKDFPPQVVPLQADPDALALVISNLLGNAVKYTPPKGRVLIRLNPDLPAGQVVVSVEDTGIGISAEDLPLVSSGFYRTAAGTATAKGFGIGLKVCKDILESHGSRLEVESSPGQGSRFFFRLPILSEAAPPGKL